MAVAGPAGDADVNAVVGGYLKQDPESLGYAAVIEWTNPDADRSRAG